MPLPTRTRNPVTVPQLAAMRSTTRSTLPDTCDVQLPVRTEDATGGWTDAYATSFSAPCRIWPAGRLHPDEQTLARRLQGRAPLYVTLPYDAVVPDQARIVRQSDGLALEVLGGGATLTWPTETRVLCAEVA